MLLCFSCITIRFYREFADAPDWSYLDGRPAPLGSGQRKRYLQQVEYNQTIQRMIHEVDTAKTAEAERIQKIAETKQQIIANKLRPKGKDLFSENNNISENNKYKTSQARKRPSLSRRVENN